jgi:hypothetical protein
VSPKAWSRYLRNSLGDISGVVCAAPINSGKRHEARWTYKRSTPLLPRSGHAFDVTAAALLELPELFVADGIGFGLIANFLM